MRLNSISKLAFNLNIYRKLNILKNVERIINKQKKKVIKKKELEISVIPKKFNIFPNIGIGISFLLVASIDIKGTIAAIENDSKIPFIICKRIKIKI